MKLGSLYGNALSGDSTLADLIMVSSSHHNLGFQPMLEGKDKDKRGFLFHTLGEESVTLQSDITDYTAENNAAIQNHIALKPITITVSGFVGELTNAIQEIDPDDELSSAAEIVQKAKDVADRVSIISSYAPSLTATATRIYNTTEQLYRAFKKVFRTVKKAATINFKNVLNGGQPLQTEQQKAFDYFYSAWKNRTLFWVQTPYRQFENMAILSLKTTQNEDSRYISDFEITFKEITFVETVLVDKRTSDKVRSKKISDKGTQKV